MELPLHQVYLIGLGDTGLGMTPKVQNDQWKDVYYSCRVNDVVIYFIIGTYLL